jgi:hypothetical protein
MHIAGDVLVGSKVRFSPIAVRCSEGPLTEPTPAAQAWERE